MSSVVLPPRAVVWSRPRFGLALLFAFLGAIVIGVRANESDSRLHSNGEVWRFDAANRTSARQPRVLLVGDSILNGYLAAVRRRLEGRADVDAWVNPHHQGTRNLDRLVAEVAAHGPYDVIHFNMGLHGWQKGRIPEGRFEPLTRQLVVGLRQGCPHGQLIWASSTPVTTKGRPAHLDPEINATIVEHNRLAAAVMSSEGVKVNDLYSVLVNQLDLATGDQFHWKKPASEKLADHVAAAILRELPGP